jgi:hypothetical protein
MFYHFLSFFSRQSTVVSNIPPESSFSVVWPERDLTNFENFRPEVSALLPDAKCEQAFADDSSR